MRDRVIESSLTILACLRIIILWHLPRYTDSQSSELRRLRRTVICFQEKKETERDGPLLPLPTSCPPVLRTSEWDRDRSCACVSGMARRRWFFSAFITARPECVRERERERTPLAWPACSWSRVHTWSWFSHEDRHQSNVARRGYASPRLMRHKTDRSSNQLLGKSAWLLTV